MRRHLLLALALLGFFTLTPPRAPGHAPQAQSPAPGPRIAGRTEAIRPKIDAELSSLEALYKDLHTPPELSLTEVRTADRMAKELQALGFEVTTKVGSTGVVGLLKNGPGPTVLVR